MKDIRLCDEGSFDETINNCINNNVGIEIQQFHDLTKRNLESDEEFNNRLLSDVKKVKDSIKQISGGRSMHGPFWEMNVGSKVPEIVATARMYYELAYRIAEELGCTEIVFHNGYFPGTSFEPKWTERAILFWKEFLKDKGDITICIENQFELDSEMLVNLIDGVHDDRLKVCLDIGHAHANSNMSVEEWIESLGDRIAYYHLHNNHGKQNIPRYNNDEHFGLEFGTIDIPRVLRYAEEYSPNAIWNIESHIDYHLEDLDLLRRLDYLKGNQK